MEAENKGVKTYMRIRKKKWALPELEECGYYYPLPGEYKGNWQAAFSKKQPLHLDLGCGKGVFLADCAFAHPEVNFIGIDISVDILGVARRNITSRYGERPVENIALFSYNIEKLPEVFGAEEGISRIYVNFCNPWPKARAHKKRLTHPNQLLVYRQLLAPAGEIWFKTDDDDLYLATRRYFAESGFTALLDTDDLHARQDAENFFSEHEHMFTDRGIRTKAIRVRVET